MARETGLWRWLRGASSDMRERLHMNRVENGVMKGMPDVEGHLQAHRQFWLELKSSERPVRCTTPVRFKVKNREAQVEWLAKRWAVGGLAWLLLQVGSGAQRRIYLVPGENALAVYGGLDEQQLQQLDRLHLLRPRPTDVVKRASGYR